MGGKLSSYLTAYLCSYVRVTIAIGPDPASQAEKRRANRLNAACLFSKNPIIESTVNLRNSGEERVVEHIDNGVRFLYGGRLLHRNGRSAHQCIYFLKQMTLIFR